MEIAKNFTPTIPYQRRQPEKTLLYRVIQNNILTSIQKFEEGHISLPQYIKNEFFKFLDCGILSKGFVRVNCGDCKQVKLVAFSCKTRGLCPACGGRRMNQTAANLVDNVIPLVPIRQWVLSVPFNIRYLMAFNAQILNQILSIYIRTINRFYINQGKKFDLKNPNPAAITFIQRFGGSCNLNIHFHTLFVDGVFYEKSSEERKFFRASPPTDKEVEELLLKLEKRILRALKKSGYLSDKENGRQALEDLQDQNPLLAKIFEASIINKIGLRLQEGEPLLKVNKGHQNGWTPYAGTRLSYTNGFSLHANITIPGHHRQELEKLICYTARPALSNSRISETEDGQILFELKRAYDDGTTHLRFTQKQFIEKLMAIIPPPRFNLVRYHGGFAPNSPIRKKIVPVNKIKPKLDEVKTSDGSRSNSYWIFWSELFRRTFKIDVLKCDLCGGKMKTIGIVIKNDGGEALRLNFDPETFDLKQLSNPSTWMPFLRWLGLSSKVGPEHLAEIKNAALKLSRISRSDLEKVLDFCEEQIKVLPIYPDTKENGGHLPTPMDNVGVFAGEKPPTTYKEAILRRFDQLVEILK